MRNLFLALVLANLGFAAWHAWLGSTAKAPPPSASGESRLTLVKEVESSDAEFAPAGSGNVESAPAGSGAAAAVPANESGATAERGGGAGRAPAGPADGASASAKSRASRESETIKAAVTAAEAASAAAASNGSPARTDAAADAGERCVSVGPFLDLGQATTASAKLRTAGYEPTQRAGEGEVWVGYWVYLDAIPSQEEANRILSVLHDKGIAEAYVFQGDDGKIISLGVFTEIARAGRLRDQVRALGFEPLVVDRTRREDVYWIDLMLKAGREVDFEALQTPGRITRLEQRPCGTPFAAAGAPAPGR